MPSYCIKGIDNGYLNSSPLDDFTLAIIIHTTFSVTSTKIMGIPIIIKHKGIASTIYRRIESSKLSEDLPLKSTHCDSSFLESQQIKGPIILPNGKKNPANAER